MQTSISHSAARLQRRFTLQALMALAIVWTVVWAGGRMIERSLPSAERLAERLAAEPLADGASRDAMVRAVTEEYAALPFLERRKLRTDHPELIDGFIAKLSGPEKAAFVDRVLPAGFYEMLRSFSSRPDGERLRDIDRAKNEYLGHIADPQRREQISKFDARMLNGLLTAQAGKVPLDQLFRQLPPDIQIQALPFIEQLHNNVRKLHD